MRDAVLLWMDENSQRSTNDFWTAGRIATGIDVCDGRGVAGALKRLSTDGLVRSTYYRRRRWWEITEAGRLEAARLRDEVRHA